MNKAEIIEAIAQARMVETMVQNIAHESLSTNTDLCDLSQMVYVILLEYDEDKLQDLWEHNQMRFFLARIIVNQYRSSNSPFFITYKKFRTIVDEEICVLKGGCSLEALDILETERVLCDED